MADKTTSTPTSLAGFPEIRREPIGGWQGYLREGNQFLATANQGFAGRREVFTAEILYNLVSMGIEKLIMAVLMKTGNLPYNHTMHDLVEAMEEFLPGALNGLGDELKALDGFQEICDPYRFRITKPTMEEVSGMLELAGKLKTMVLARIGD